MIARHAVRFAVLATIALCAACTASTSTAPTVPVEQRHAMFKISHIVWIMQENRSFDCFDFSQVSRKFQPFGKPLRVQDAQCMRHGESTAEPETE